MMDETKENYSRFMLACNELSDFAIMLSDNYWEEEHLYSDNVYRTFLHEYSLSCHIAHLITFEMISPSILSDGEVESIFELHDRYTQALTD